MKEGNEPTKIAIIGASVGQLPLVKKAKELGLYTVCFAWPKGAVCKDVCDEFYPISIFDIDDIVKKCEELGIAGVATTASEETALVTATVAERLKLNGVSPDVIRLIQNKRKVRQLTSCIEGLSKPKTWNLSEQENITYPCVLKPIKGSAKKGVSFCKNPDDLENAIKYADTDESDIIVEEYIPGEEYSVESLSFHGIHDVIQITRKVSTGFPHFAELEHHQPAPLTEKMRATIVDVIQKILSTVGYTDGASHVEIKVHDGKVYLIEINPRGGGDRISDTLVGLSTNRDYVAEILNIALDRYQSKETKNLAYSGIMYLTAQNERILKYFDNINHGWEIEKKRFNEELTVSASNYDRDGYIIYRSETPLNL